MAEQERAEFAKFLMEYVRDISIRECDMMLRAENPRSPTSKRYNNANNELDARGYAEMIIADAVDTTIFHLLDAIDNQRLRLSYNTNRKEDKFVELPRDIIGELAGWYIGEWRFEYSKERSIDDFPDLTL